MADTQVSIDTQRYFTDGAAYERMMGPWSRAAGHIFLDWLALPNGLRWLDVGCGTGVFTQLILDRCGPRIVSAVDPAADQIAYANTKPAAKRVSFQLGDAQALLFADGEFDVAVMALVIAFVADPAKALAELKRVVRPDGMVATYMWDFLGNGSPPHPMRDAVEAMGFEVPLFSGHRHSRLESLQDFFAGAGLAEIAMRTIEVQVPYPDFDAFWSVQTGLGNSTTQLIKTMNAAQTEKLKNYLRAHLPTDSSGRIAYPAKANAVKGRVPQ